VVVVDGRGLLGVKEAEAELRVERVAAVVVVA
jgi:hypothetical protein